MTGPITYDGTGPAVCVLCGVESWRILGLVCTGCEYDRHAWAWCLAEERWRCAVLDADRFAVMQEAEWLLAESDWGREAIVALACTYLHIQLWLLTEARWWAEMECRGAAIHPGPGKEPWWPWGYPSWWDDDQ